MQKNSSVNAVNATAAVLIVIIGYIIICAIVAIPMKYIFFDYFARIGWSTDFSYMTTIMIILGLRMLYAAITFTPKINVQSPNNK